MKKVIVFITLKQGVLDPQGKAVEQSLHSLGYLDVAGVRVGKYLEFFMDETKNIDLQIKEMCEKLLANPVIEDYRYVVEEVVHS